MQRAVLTAVRKGPTGELVGVPAALEAKMLENLKGHILRQHRNTEHTGFGNHVVGEVGPIHCKGQPLGGIRKLNHRIDDAAIVLSLRRSRQNKQAIGQLKQCVGVHRLVRITGELCFGHGVRHGLGQNLQLLRLF